MIMMVARKKTTRKTVKKRTVKKTQKHDSLIGEIRELHSTIGELKRFNKTLKQEIKETRMIIYLSIALLMILFGLILSVSLKIFL